MLKECCLLRHVNISESQAVGWRSACMQWFGPVQIWTLSVHWGSGDARASYFQLLFLFSSLLISFKPVNILLSEVGKSDGRGAELLYRTQPGLTDGDRRLFLREKTRKKQAEEFHGCFANIVGQSEFYLYAVHPPSRNHRSIFFLSGVFGMPMCARESSRRSFTRQSRWDSRCSRSARSCFCASYSQPLYKHKKVLKCFICFMLNYIYVHLTV